MSSTTEFGKPKNSDNRIIKIVAAVACVGLFIGFAAYIGVHLGRLFGAIIASCILAYLFAPLQSKLEKKLPAWLSALLILLIIIGFFVALCLIILPYIIRQFSGLFEQIASLLQSIFSAGDRLQAWLDEKQIHFSIQNIFGSGATKLNEYISGFAEKMLQAIINFSKTLPAIVLVPILTFYFLKGRKEICKSLVFLIPVGIRESTRQIGRGADKTIKNYISSQLLVAGIVGLATAVGYWILGVSYAVPLGIVMAVGEIIPYFGPVIAAIPACLIGLIESPDKILWIIAVVVIVQQLENNVLSPWVMSSTFDMNPITVIIILWLFGELFGFVGFLFAVPIYIIIKDVAVLLFNKLVKAR